MSFLPQTLISATSDWLDTVDAALDEILASTKDIDPEIASSVARAVGGVRHHSSQFRQVIRGEAAIDLRADSDWVPLGSIDRILAERIHAQVIQAASLSTTVLDTAHRTLADAAERRAFLLHVGDVAGNAFLNLAQNLWEDYPDLAPDDWAAGKGPFTS